MNDLFVRQYVATALWSTNDDDGVPLDTNYDIDDLAPETLAKMVADCQKFRQQACRWLDEHDDITDAAHDFWLTRNGHGCGFGDGDWPINGDKLTTISKAFRECTLYVGDDGMIYV